VNEVARKLLAEFIGTFALIFIGCGSVVMAGAAVAGATPETGLNSGALVAVALAHGLVIACIVSAIGHISGGHINPAVTLGVWISRGISTTEAGMYWIAQLLGGAVGAFLLLAVLPSQLTDAVNLGTPSVNTAAGMAAGGAAVLEAVLTFFLVFAVYGTAVDPKGAWNKVAAFSIGLVVTFDILVGGPMTGGAMNPARWFGPALATGTWTNAWVYIVGPLAGGAIAGLVYWAAFLKGRPEVTVDDAPADL
jgi:MIP family channel proteins